jgi:uncharacterized protein YndB with AHSA1/START domain
MPDILHRGAIESSAVKVFHVLSEERGLAGWWTGDVDASPTVGAIDQFRFGDHGFNNMKVVELVRGKRVKRQCVDGAREWIGTALTFDLKEENRLTVLLFAQRGWKEPVELCTTAASNGRRAC